MTTQTNTLPIAFVWRRLHSLFGLWIVLFLVEHLLTNSQAALLVGENGMGFVRAVNFIKHLPYLPAIEIVLLGVPILFHGIWGIQILMTSKMNAFKRKNNHPSLPSYARNHAYSWQRITSWILLIGIIAHVGFMRFYMYPASVNLGTHSDYFVRIKADPGLNTVANRLGVKLYHAEAIKQLKEEVKITSEQKAWIKGLTKRTPSKGEVIAQASDFGTATLLVVRDSFQSVFTAILYTLFVFAAVYHGFNGLWTFMITWGIVLKMRSQSRAINWCVGIMFVVGFLGLASIWGTYFINLRN